MMIISDRLVDNIDSFLGGFPQTVEKQINSLNTGEDILHYVTDDFISSSKETFITPFCIPAISYYLKCKQLREEEWIKVEKRFHCFLNSCSRSYRYKTANAIINNIVDNMYTPDIIKIYKDENNCYYGNKHVIFDKDFHPLIIPLFKVIVNLETRKLDYKGFYLYVSPRVFTNNDVVSKNIINKWIPFVSNNKVAVVNPEETVLNMGAPSFYHYVETNFEVVISNFIDKIIKKNNIKIFLNYTLTEHDIKPLLE